MQLIVANVMRAVLTPVNHRRATRATDNAASAVE